MYMIQSIISVIVLLLSAQLAYTETMPSNQQLKTDVDTTQNTVLWKISGNGLTQPSYVFANWHLLCRNEIIFKNKVKLAISQTEQLLMQNFITYLSADDYFERQTANQRINRGIPIYQIDDRKQRKKLLKLIDKNLDLKIDRAKRVMPVVKRMTPMEVYFSSMHSFINDCDGLGSFDDLLFNHYQKNGAAIGSVNERKVFMESLMASGFVSPESLTAYLEDIESQKALVREMKLAYYRHEKLVDLNKLYRIFLNNSFTEPTKIDRYILELDVQPWVEIIKQWMFQKPTFISINASYLMGEGGVLDVLRQQGFTLEPVN